jgi:hypothetical protein
LVASFLAPIALHAQNTATTTPVGYETISLIQGFNYVGLRLHNAPIASGTLEVVTNTSLTDTGVDVNALLEAGKTYVLEITNTSGVGAVAEIVKSNVINDTINTNNAFAELGVTAPATYLIRPSATLASVFGVNNTFGLQPGFSGPGGADLIYVPRASGGFDQYFYDEDELSWKNAESNELVNPVDVPLVYLDGILIFANAPRQLVVSGTIKKESVVQLVKPGFNYISSVYPASATLASAFNNSLASINPGFSGPAGADTVYVVNDGSITEYFYDADESSWKNSSTNAAINPEQVSLPSGLIYFNAGNNSTNLKNDAPANYSGL